MAAALGPDANLVGEMRRIDTFTEKCAIFPKSFGYVTVMSFESGMLGCCMKAWNSKNGFPQKHVRKRNLFPKCRTAESKSY